MSNGTEYTLYPDSKIHGVNMGSTGPRWAPCCPMNIAIWVVYMSIGIENSPYFIYNLF